VSPAKREPRAITLAEIEHHFQLASYWFGDKWCPAVHPTATGYGIRIVRSQTWHGANASVTYDYFELGPDGTVDIAPRGFARDFKPSRVVDIAAEAERYAVPDPAAMRIGLLR
jgi:hypothetical protein